MTLAGPLNTAFYLHDDYPGFSIAAFTPALPLTGMVELLSRPGHRFTLTFDLQLTDPVVHLGSLGSTLTFPAGTSVTRLSGDTSDFAVSGNVVTGGYKIVGEDGVERAVDSNGSVQLSGTFTSITFILEPRGPAGISDGVFLQVGGQLPTLTVRRSTIKWAGRATDDGGRPLPAAAGAPDCHSVALFEGRSFAFSDWQPVAYEGLAQLLGTVTSGDAVSEDMLAQADVVAFEMNGNSPAHSGGWESCDIELRDSQSAVLVHWSESTVDGTFLGTPVPRDHHVIANGSVSGDRYGAIFGIPPRFVTTGEPTLTPEKVVVSFLLLRVREEIDVRGPAFRLRLTGVPRTAISPSSTPDVDAIGVLAGDDEVPLIGSVRVRPSVARPGEPVLIEVLGNDEHLLDPSVVEATINGILGASQHLQYPTPGVRRLTVLARDRQGRIDRSIVLLDVQGAAVTYPTPNGRGDDIAVISVTQSAVEPYKAILTLGSNIDVRSSRSPNREPVISSPDGSTFQTGSAAARLEARGLLGRLMARSPSSLIRVDATRLTNTRRTGTRRRRGRSKPVPTSFGRRAVSRVYDLSPFELADLAEELSAPAPDFIWDFGDGHNETTKTPVAVHDYFASMDHSQDLSQFVVTCTVSPVNVVVRRTLTVYSAYALCRKSGPLVPHVEADFFAHKRFNRLSGVFTIYNVEDQQLVLDKVSVTAHVDDGEAVSLPAPFTALDQVITVAPHSQAVIGVNVPFVVGSTGPGELPFDVKSFDLLYAGAAAVAQVRCSVSFDVPAAEWSRPPVNPPVLALAEPAGQRWPWEAVQVALAEAQNRAGLDADSTILDTKTGTVAVACGAIEHRGSRAHTRDRVIGLLDAVYAPVESSAGDRRRPSDPLLPGVFTLEGPPPPGSVVEGQVCDPDNLTEVDLAAADAGQLVCQLTEEVKDISMPARWMNARKGDCILSPGGDGIIGGLMLNVTPEQWYSHCGIMSRNYDEITHSTGSQRRLMDHLIGFTADGSDGFEPRILKYIWPGAVTQTVQCSIEGEDFPDPEYAKTYSISAFGAHQVGVTHNDQMKMIPPLVLKPDPLEETPAVRLALHAIATAARSDAGRPGIKPKYHYRWYCYSDPAIGLLAPEGSAAGWAEGTRPSVCSSYVWLHAKALGAQLEADQALVNPVDLEPSDINAGAVVRPATVDGLYTYSAEERSAAADWLYNTVYNQAYEKAGWFGEILTDGADDIANQFLNAFARDVADGKDSDEWKEIVSADAVSPDNMLWWDPPRHGGLYGFTEPAIYREPRVESFTVSRWKKVLTRGTVRGTVRTDMGLISGAFVQVFDGKSTFTGPDGGYQLNDVPFGVYQLKASKVIDGVLFASQANVTVNAADLVADLHLQGPDERFRLAQIFIDFWGRDEENFGDDEINDPQPEYLELDLGPDRPVNGFGRTYKWGGEVRVEYGVTLRLLVNNAIDVQVEGKLFEGTSEDTDDLDGTGGLSFQSARGQTTGATLTITNTDEDDDDAGVLSISVKNVRNTN